MKIHTLDLHFQGHPDTIAAFLIVGDQEELSLVESGPYSTYPALQKAVAEMGYRLEDVQHVFLSHIHFDHAGAAWALAQLGARVYVHPMGYKHLMNPERLYHSAKMIYGDQMESLWGRMEDIPAEQLVVTEHGKGYQASGQLFTAWHTPGHAIHHVAWQLGDVLFTGDVAGVKIGAGIVVPPCPPPDIQIEDWRHSIMLIRELPLKRLYLTHYGAIDEIGEHLDALEKRLGEWADWMRPYYEKGIQAAEVAPLFQEYVNAELRENGIEGEQLEQYESANPAFMSVAGLMRYWHKKLSLQ